MGPRSGTRRESGRGCSRRSALGRLRGPGQAEWREASLEVVEALRPMAAARGVPLSQLALRWAMANAQVHSIIIGPRTLAQADDALMAAAVPWDAELEAAVDALVPPGTHSGREWPDPAYYPVTGRTLA